MKMPFVYQREIVLFGQHDCDPVYESTLWGGAGRGGNLSSLFVVRDSYLGDFQCLASHVETWLNIVIKPNFDLLVIVSFRAN